MGKTLRDITMYSKAIVDAECWKLDPKMLPIPWRPVDLPKKLKIAVLYNDGICLPTPPVTRALKETAVKLKKAGHEVLAWNPKLHAKAIELLGRMFVADGGKSVEALLGVTGEPYRPEMLQYKDAKELGVYDMWKLHTERSELQRQYLEQWMAIEGLDAILGKTERTMVLLKHSFLTIISSNNPILKRSARRLQIRRIYRRVQRG